MSDTKLAIIHGVGYGLRDFPDGKPGLWFGVSWDNEGYGALVAFTHDETQEFITKHNIYNVFHLEGEFCYIIDAPTVQIVSLVKSKHGQEEKQP